MRPWILLTLSIAACSGAEAHRDPVAIAREALDDGLPRRALSEVGTATSGPGLIVRLAALVDLDEWDDYDKLVRAVPAGPEKAALGCLLGASQKDVAGERKCRAIDQTALEPWLADATERALGRVLETENRREEAEVVLRQLAQRRPTNGNRKAVVAYLERQGFVREAVAYLEAWHADKPTDSSLELKLAQALERKVRGDLLEKRGEEAEAAARRLLVLQPQRAEIRYFLADALALRGDTTAAEAERAAAKAAGAKPPVPPDTMPGLDPGQSPPAPPGRGP